MAVNLHYHGDRLIKFLDEIMVEICSMRILIVVTADAETGQTHVTQWFLLKTDHKQCILVT